MVAGKSQLGSCLRKCSEHVYPPAKLPGCRPGRWSVVAAGISPSTLLSTLSRRDCLWKSFNLLCGDFHPRQFISNIGHLCPSPRDSELTGLGDSLGTRPRIILMGYKAEGHWIWGTCVVMILKGDASISTELWPDEFCAQVAGPLR